MSLPNYAQGKVIHNVTSEFIESYCSSDNKDRQYLYSSLPLQNIEQKRNYIGKDEFFLCHTMKGHSGGH